MSRTIPRPCVADLSSHDMAALRATGQTLGVAFAVGKEGVTEGVVKELQNRLSREPLVKVRILAGAREGEEEMTSKDIARDLAAKARVTLVEVRGHTALFHRPPRHKRGPDDF